MKKTVGEIGILNSDFFPTRFFTVCCSALPEGEDIILHTHAHTNDVANSAKVSFTFKGRTRPD
jgi:hypothetical protein